MFSNLKRFVRKYELLLEVSTGLNNVEMAELFV